jgi:RNA polymerase-binding transcription factor DksA
MSTVANRIYYDKLQKRQEQIQLTVEHIKNERRGVEANVEWMDPKAYQNRMNLLNQLTGWYNEEVEAIEKAFERIKDGRYGLCTHCHKPVETERLELYPDTEFCLDCQELREY